MERVGRWEGGAMEEEEEREGRKSEREGEREGQGGRK